MNHLRQLEDQSVYILREAYKHFDHLAMLWSMGKDSTVLLWLARKAFFGHVPFPLLHVDTSYKIPAMIEYRDRIAREWRLNLVVGQNKEALAAGMNPSMGRVTCCTALKTQGLKNLIEEKGYTGVILGVRADEEGTRAKERYFSPRDKHGDWDFRDQPPELWDQFKITFPTGTHIRVHPLLDWTEINIWEYIKYENIPFMDLYLDKETAHAIEASAARRAHSPLNPRRRRSTTSLKNCVTPPSPSAPGAHRMREEGWSCCAKTATCKVGMVKPTSSFVLGSKNSSTYPRGYASGFFSPAALLACLFEHSITSDRDGHHEYQAV